MWFYINRSMKAKCRETCLFSLTGAGFTVLTRTPDQLIIPLKLQTRSLKHTHTVTFYRPRDGAVSARQSRP